MRRLLFHKKIHRFFTVLKIIPKSILKIANALYFSLKKLKGYEAGYELIQPFHIKWSFSRE